MTDQNEPTLTHRLLAKSLGVTVTTIKSYRRKFPEFWRTASQGKPIRFPTETLDLCRRIQQHFKRGLSVEETRKRLAGEFKTYGTPPTPGPAGQAAAEPAHDQLTRIEGVLESLFTLQNRTHSLLAELVSKLDTLADRLGPASAQTPAQTPAQSPAPAPPSPGSARIAQAIDHAVNHTPGVLRREPGPASGPPLPEGPRPPAEFMDLPVVIRTGEGEFLGVTNKSGRPFTLAQFEAFLTMQAEAQGRPTALWLHQGQEWTLRLESQGRASDHHFLQAVTPRGNNVAQFASLSVGGTPASEAAMQAFLRQVKDTLDQ